MAEPAARNPVKVCGACNHGNVAAAELCAACGALLKLPARPVRLDETAADRASRNPFLRWLLHLGAPLTASVGIHAALLVVVALIVASSVRHARVSDVGDYEASISNADLSCGLSFDQPAPPLPDTPDTLNTLTHEFSASVELQETPQAGAGTGDDALGAGEGGGILGVGDGAGDPGTGGHGGDVGSSGIMGRVGPWNTWFRADHVVFVVDFSGSTVTVERELKSELKRTIGALTDIQTFNVILFYGVQNRAATASFRPARVTANKDHKTAFNAWIDQQSTGFGSDPRPAVTLALAQQPQAIVFLSDGRFENSYVDELTQANARVHAQFVCFLFDEAKFGDRSHLPPTVDDNGRRLQRLAQQNKGRDGSVVFKIVTGQDVYGG